MVDIYKKINKYTGVIDYYATREWNFSNRNTKKLQEKMMAENKKLLPFDMSDLNWTVYLKDYLRGGRIYILKDPLEKIPKGLVHHRKFKYIHYGSVFAIVICFYFMGVFLYNCFVYLFGK